MKIYIDDFNIDCGIVFEENTHEHLSHVHGFSCAVTATITGELNGEEQVVIDFGTAKKRIKEAIDAKIDHHLLVPYVFKERQKDSDITTTGITRVTFCNESLYKKLKEESESKKSLYALATVVKYALEEVARSFDDITVEFDVQEAVHFANPYPKHSYQALVQYVHGLPHSTSTPCQFPFHGHLGSIVFKPHFLIDRETFNLAIKQVVHPKMMIINQKYVKAKVIDGDITIGLGLHFNNEFKFKYTSDLTGYEEYDLSFNKDFGILILDTDSTIENLHNYIGNQLACILKGMGYTNEQFELFVSEGLKKGALGKFSI